MWTLCLSLEPFCSVSSCVHEFWDRPYLLLSTLSRSTSWLPSSRGEERDTEREGCLPFSSSVIYRCSSLVKVWPQPNTRNSEYMRIFILLFSINTDVTGVESSGLDQHKSVQSVCWCGHLIIISHLIIDALRKLWGKSSCDIESTRVTSRCPLCYDIVSDSISFSSGVNRPP